LKNTAGYYKPAQTVISAWAAKVVGRIDTGDYNGAMKIYLLTSNALT